MEWTEYEESFVREAVSNNYSQEYIDICLRYAYCLHSKGLPIIFNQQHFSLLVGYSLEYLYSVSNASEKFYRSFTIPKKSCGVRTILEPLPSLKEIQHWILRTILNAVEVSKYAKGFVKGTSIKTNARFHRNQPFVLSLDIKDFFSSTRSSDVYQAFNHLGYSTPVSVLLTNLCCYKSYLPQGAPTSPALSNIVAYRLDKRIAGYALIRGIRYTRYADDMTFSGCFYPGELISFVESVISDYGYRLNLNKIRLMHQHQRQETTGIVVNKFLRAPREYRREIRQVLYYIKKHGIESHMEVISANKDRYINQLIGKANHVLFVDKNDRDAKELLQYILNK